MKDNLQFINIGYGNYIDVARIVAILTPDGAAARRLKDLSREKGILFDATQGRKTRSIVVLDTNQIFVGGAA